ncbi:hypothetical protein LSCM1_06553 [Leishmania martiniquensis]|uniref:Chromatin binding protein n=1 Tax=Leishmania martiniquensis TaxID=1580590 RepID=A0A836KT65_9TRYP|nr:hypothetical protein LSCM1_06553 [Leishmania martiniquensis]
MPTNGTTSASTMAAGPVYTAIAVCGCGHDGRLGIGRDAPSTMSEVALIEDFLPSFAAADTVGEVRQVACGAYHTLVLTSMGLYGWGLHEDGQLGLGRPSTATTKATAWDGALGEASPTAAAVPTHVDRPLRIPFAAFSGVDRAEADVPVTIISVHCGAHHSFVYSTAGVYVTGRNNCGQLGLGHTDNVFTWTRLCAALPLRTADGDAVHTSETARSTMPIMSSLPSAQHSNQSGRHMRLLYGRLTHISCGTDHTLLAWSDAVILRTASPSSADTQQPPINAHESGKLLYYPSLLTACGRGDFGELGYDGDAWAVLQAKAQRQERALRSAKQQQGTHGGDDDGQHSSADATYKFKWKAAATVKQRRPPFNSAFFEAVEGVSHLEESAVTLSATCAEEVGAALLRQACIVSGRAEDLIWPCHGYLATDCAGLPPIASVLGTCSGVAGGWEVVKLQAMHHHSAVTLRRRHGEGQEQQVVLHWGCYYCSDIEDSAASHPRDIFADMQDAFNSYHDVRTSVLRGSCGGIHAGEESLLRYMASRRPSVPATTVAPARDDEVSVAASPFVTSSAHAPLLQIMGSGNLGLGIEDSFTRSWTNLACLGGRIAAGGQAKVQAVVGRSHYLILTHTERASRTARRSSADAASLDGKTADGEASAVFGFGDNLHGQLGAPALQAVDASEDVIVVAPRVVLQDGNVLRTATSVQRSLRNAAAPPAHHNRSAAAKMPQSSTSAAEALYEVVAIRAVEAGARHSIFLVDARPIAAAAASGAANS